MKPEPPLVGIEARFREEMFAREARAEKFACLLWLAVIALTYAFFLLGSDFTGQLRRDISLLVAVTVPGFLLIYVLIRYHRYRPVLAYANTLLQLTVVSGAIYFDTRAYGIQYAMSSMPPIAYGLVVVVTAFRLRPFMGIFAGLVAAAQFLAIYVWVSRRAVDATPELFAAIPSLDWEVTMMKVVVLVGLGTAGSFSAYSLRRELTNFIATAREEMRLHNSLGRYVSREVADALKRGDSTALAPAQSKVAVMFGDIRNFTRFANNHEPGEVADMVNHFFDQVDAAITAEGGVLNKFLGDGFMAVFGLFDQDADARVQAVRAGFRILETTREELQSRDMGVGIAVNYGQVVAGEIGAAGRCEYTVLGNTVNVAARLEGMNRKLGTEFLITRALLGQLPAGLAAARSMGSHDVRGIQGAMELVALSPSA